MGPVGVSSMDDHSLPLSLTSHLLIAPLGVDCKFAVLNKKKKDGVDGDWHLTFVLDI